jgi:predicted MFS family arabinose efflux permease
VATQAPAAAVGGAPSRAHALGLAMQISLAAAVSLGLGRFAYALLVPHMRAELGWSYAQAGTLNTLNAAGYLFGAALAGAVIAVTGVRRTYVSGLLLVTGSLLASALTGSFGLLLALRFTAGIAGALAFIAGVTIVAELAAASVLRPTLIVGVYTAGAGLGIALSGLVIPGVLALSGGNSWRPGWWTLGALAACCSAVATRGSLRIPAHAIGRRHSARWPATRLLPTLAAYALFGAGYIAYATFVIALLRQRAAGTAEIASFWTLLGLAAIFSTFAWPSILTRLHGGTRPATVLAVVLAGITLLAVDDTPTAAFLSAALFGGSFLAVITAVTTVAQDSLQRHHWAAAVAGLTTAFAIGQTLGPTLTGWVSDRRGLQAGLLVSAALVLAASLTALLQRTPRTE